MDVDGYTMWVVGGSLLIVAPQITDDQRQRALASLAAAQHAADDSMGSRFEGQRCWARAYRKALGEHGWGVVHSCQSVESAERRGVLAPLQPLLLWLSAVHPHQADVLERCVAALNPRQDGLRQLSRRALQASQDGARLVVELGLLLPGPALSLCSIALETARCPDPEWLLTTFPGPLLHGDIHFQGLMLEPALGSATRTLH